MKRKIIASLIFIVFAMSNMTVCFASEGNKTYDINSLEKLNETIEAFEGNKISKTNSEHIIEETSPDVLIEYMDEIDNVAIDYFENAEPVEKTYDDENDCSIIVYRVQVDPLPSVELVLMDQEESSALNKFGKSIKNIFVDECYAATNGDTMWKSMEKDIILQNIQGVLAQGMRQYVLKTIIV